MKRKKKCKLPDGYKFVPVDAAKEVAEKFDKDIVVIVSYQEAGNMFHCTTYGDRPVHKIVAAQMGENCMRAAGADPVIKNTYEDFRFRTEAEWAKEREQLHDRIKKLESALMKSLPIVKAMCSTLAETCPVEDAEALFSIEDALKK